MLWFVMDSIELTQPRLDDIIDWMHFKKMSFNTIKQYKSTLYNIADKFGHVGKDNLRKIMKDYKYQNQRAVLYNLKAYCFDKGREFDLPIPRVKSPPTRIPDMYSSEEIKLMITAAPHPWNLALRCIYNLGAGLRVSEVLKLSWSHIGWVEWLPNKSNYGIAKIKQAKGKKDRVVNIPSNLMNDLYEYAKQQNMLNEFRVPVGQVIFPVNFGTYKVELMSEDMERWKFEYIRQAYDWFRYNIIKKHCEKAIGKKIKVHSLRHSRATYLYEIEKVPIERIQKLLGHASIATTMIYTDINPMSTFELLKNTSEI